MLHLRNAGELGRHGPEAGPAAFEARRHDLSGSFAKPQHKEGNTFMEWIGAIIIGLVAGVIAKLIMPGRDPGGFIVTTLLGIVGALVATWLGRAIGWYGEGEAAGFIGAVIGAIILLAIYRMVAGRRTT